MNDEDLALRERTLAFFERELFMLTLKLLPNPNVGEEERKLLTQQFYIADVRYQKEFDEFEKNMEDDEHFDDGYGSYDDNDPYDDPYE